MRQNSRKITYAAICLALCMVLPFITGHIPQIASALSPMHIPVLLCGFACGPVFGGIVGFTAPLLRYMLFGMPPIMPSGIPMAFELMTYGIVSGTIYSLLKKNTLNVYISLITAMICGRIVWGLVKLFLAGLTGSAFTMELFLAGILFGSIPGIILHIILIPLIVLALRRAKLID